MKSDDMDSLRQRLERGEILIGSWINTSSSIVAEIMSASGFDFLVVDAEHSAVDISQAQLIFQAIQAGNPGCMPMVRLPGNVYAETKRYLDAGAVGVVAPFINSAEEVRELVRSVKYPPLGERGVGYGRSHGYGFTFQQYMDSANELTIVCIQIEDIRGVENLDEILSEKGIDAAMIGPYDLSASMGITGQFENPSYLAARDKILEKCGKHGIAAGIHVVQPNPEEVFERIDEGFRMIAYSLDITMLGTACRQALERIKKRIGDDPQ